MLIRFASLLLAAVLAACAANKPQVLTETAAPGDTRPPLREGFESEYRDGLLLMEEQKFEEAVGFWTALTQQSGEEYPGVWTNLGLALQQLGRTDDALAAYDYVVKLDSSFCPVYALKGILERDAGKFDQAQASYEAGIECQPDQGALYFNLGILFDLYRNDLASALDNYRKARRLIPDEDILNMWITDLSRRLDVAEEDPESIDIWQQDVQAELARRKAAAAALAAAASGAGEDAPQVQDASSDATASETEPVDATSTDEAAEPQSEDVHSGVDTSQGPAGTGAEQETQGTGEEVTE